VTKHSPFARQLIEKSLFAACDTKKMKTQALSLFFLAVTAAGAFSQVYTKPVGFITLNLQAGNNFVGFSLQPSAAFAGAFTVSPSDRSRIFLTNAAVSNDQFNGAAGTFVMEITSAGATQGANTVVVDTIQAGAEIVLQEALPSGIADGSTLAISKLRTISEAFGEANSAGLTPGTATTADLLLLPTTAGGFDQYFYSPGGFSGVGWRKVGGGTTNQANVGFYPTDGFIIMARSAKNVTVTGEVKAGKTITVLETGNNLLANLCPVNAGGTNPSSEGRTLGNCGLYTGSSSTGLLGTTSANSADQVMIWNGSGYTQYYYSTGGFSGEGWRQVGGGNTDRSGVALPEGSYLVLRRGAPVMVQLTQASF